MGGYLVDSVLDVFLEGTGAAARLDEQGLPGLIHKILKKKPIAWAFVMLHGLWLRRERGR